MLMEKDSSAFDEDTRQAAKQAAMSEIEGPMMACLLRGDIRHALGLPPEHGGQVMTMVKWIIRPSSSKRMASRSAAWLRASVSNGIVVSAGVGR